MRPVVTRPRLPFVQIAAELHALTDAAHRDAGSRTAWHSHPLGQTLVVTAGCGWAQRWGGPAEVILPGDVIWFPAGEKHWHGATATTAMTHTAIQEKLDGKTVEWMEQVIDEQYQGPPPA